MHKQEFVDWLQTGEEVPCKVSVCTGSLLLGVAGVLQEKQATTHPNAYELLRPYRAKVRTDRIVITGGGVAIL